MYVDYTQPPTRVSYTGNTGNEIYIEGINQMCEIGWEPFHIEKNVSVMRLSFSEFEQETVRVHFKKPLE